MRRPRYLDFTCPTCETSHTRFVETNDDDTLHGEPEVCNENLMDYEGTTCSGVLVQNQMAVFNGYMKTIVKGSHDFNERERERLEKRGGEHWQREGRHEAIERERALFKRHGMEGTGGVR
jgi:hypothetical protein